MGNSNGVLFLLAMLPVMMIAGVMIGLYTARVRFNRLMDDIERVAQEELTRYIQSQFPAPPPSRQIAEGLGSYEETRPSRFRSFLWNTYMKAARGRRL